jgi:hypothetical protein
LLVASDGLLKYAPQAELAKRALDGRVEDAVAALVDAVRLRTGALHDDVAVVLCDVAG